MTSTPPHHKSAPYLRTPHTETGDVQSPDPYTERSISADHWTRLKEGMQVVFGEHMRVNGLSEPPNIPSIPSFERENGLGRLLLKLH